FLHRLHAGEWEIRIDGPHRLSDFSDEALRSGASAANSVRHSANHVRAYAPEIARQNRPVNGCRSRVIHSAIALVANHADDLAPRPGEILLDSLADGRSWRFPILAREVFGHDRDRRHLIQVGPRKIAAGD